MTAILVTGTRSQLSGGRVNNARELQRRGGKAYVGKTDEYKAYIERVAVHARAAHRGAPIDGPAECRLGVYWPARHGPVKRRGKPDERPNPAHGLALVDVDAMIKATLDGLQVGGVVLDDALFAKLTIEKHYDPDEPRIEILSWKR